MAGTTASQDAKPFAPRVHLVLFGSAVRHRASAAGTGAAALFGFCGIRLRMFPRRGLLVGTGCLLVGVLVRIMQNLMLHEGEVTPHQ